MIYERLDASDFSRRMHESGWSYVNGSLLQEFFFYLEEAAGDMEFDAVAIRSDFTPYDNWQDMVDEGVIDERDLADELGVEPNEDNLYDWDEEDPQEINDAVRDLLISDGRLAVEEGGEYIVHSF